VLSVYFKNVHSDQSYECTLNALNVFEEGITLLGCSEVSLAATVPCRLQLASYLLTIVLGRDSDI